MPHSSAISLLFCVAGAVVAILLTGLGLVVYLVAFRSPANTPGAWLRRGLRDGLAVVCTGDSHTSASLSADYVADLRSRPELEGWEFINAGQNGDTSLELLKRLDSIVRCQPDAVTVLIGSNDVRAGFSAVEERAFEENVRAILARLNGVNGARVAVLSVPPLGEDLADEVNRQVERCNAVLRRVAVESGATYLPLHESLKRLMEDLGASRPFELSVRVMLGAAVRRYIGRQSWDRIGDANGLIVHTDHLHLNDRAGKVVADLIAGWLVAERGERQKI